MSYQELMSRHKVRLDVSDLDAEEMELYGAFMELGETELDKQILGRAWLKNHVAEVVAWAK
jgi:hypothetical protein